MDWGLNALHGVQAQCDDQVCPTSFPMPVALGASWDAELWREVANVIGYETRALWLQGDTEYSTWSGQAPIGLDVWSPVINVGNRDPRWGRNQESPGEAPLILARYATQHTIGLQNGEDPKYLLAVVTLKHWAAYNLEDSDGYTRHTFNAVVSDYDLQATYFPMFRSAVKDGGAKGVMCSYNELNGVPTCASAFLNRTMRGLWGFDGYVTSDTDAIGDIWQTHKYVKTAPEAACLGVGAGGCDMNSGSQYWDSLLDGVDQKLCSMDDVDRALRNTMRLRFQLGLFDPIETQPYWHVPASRVNDAAAQALNKRATREGLVLLKNDGNTLPIKPGPGVKLAVIGPNANSQTVLVGSYLGGLCTDGSTTCFDTVFSAIQKSNTAAGASDADTVYELGCDVNSQNTSGFAAAVAAAGSADHVVLVMGISEAIEGESHDRTNMDLPGVQHELIAQVLAAGKPTTLVLINGGIVGIDKEKQTVPAIVEAFYPGKRGGEAIADLLFGEFSPSGKLPVTMFPNNYTDLVKMDNMSMLAGPGRTFRYYQGPVNFPFGWGLSYTELALSWPGGEPPSGLSLPTSLVEPTNTTGGASVNLTVLVTNNGQTFTADEVVQVFAVPVSTPQQPGNPLRIDLVEFERVRDLAPGATQAVSLTLTPGKFRLVDADDGALVSTPGTFELWVTNRGASKADVPLKTTMTLQGDELVIERIQSKEQPALPLP